MPERSLETDYWPEMINSSEGGVIGISFSWPKRTGTSNGNCSSKDSTSVTTSGFMTASNRTARRASGSISWQIVPYQEKLVRFMENHDEPRAAATFQPLKERAVAVTVLTQVGAGLIHEGQLEGRKVRLPVFLSRRPDEKVDTDLKNFYQRLLTILAEKGIRRGEWRLCDRTGWPDNGSFQNLVAWCWRDGEKRHVIVVNLSDVQSQGRVHLPWDDLSNRSWQLADLLSGARYRDNGNELQGEGLFVDLEPWGYHLFEASEVEATAP